MSKFDRQARPKTAATSEREAPGADESQVFPSVGAWRPLSLTLWELDITAGLPSTLSHDGVHVVAGDLDRIRSFLADEFASLTQEGVGVIPTEAIARAKTRYVEQLCDYLELRREDETVGVFIGAPEDWGTYYVRTFAVAPAYRRPHLLRRFIRERVFAPLAAAGVERVTAETSPVNIAMSRLFTELHFHATGQRLTDRWGPLIRYTKFLDRDCETVFARRFGGAAPRPRSMREGKEEA